MIIRTFFSVSFLLLTARLFAQDNIYPAPPSEQDLLITNATIHVGNGTVIPNGAILISKGRIQEVSRQALEPKVGTQVIDAKGKQVYPGLILASSQLGLVEVPPVRATVDATEIGELNPNIRALVAYNTDSKVINTLRSNGILLAEVYPGGTLLAGSSSVVQLDAWNWEDAVYAADHGIHLTLPSLLARPSGRGYYAGASSSPGDALKRAYEQIEKLKLFFREAQAYSRQGSAPVQNLKFEAVRGLFQKKQKLFIHCEIVKEMQQAIEMAQEFGFDLVIVGGSESWLIADLLKQHNIPVLLSQLHELPTLPDDAIDQRYTTPYLLQQAGVLFAISDEDGSTRSRNLPFNAGTAAAYGLTREEALSSITLNAAKILGIDNRTGSLEVGKEANLVISEGDILDMKTSLVTHAFIQGRPIDLSNKHTQLAERYRHKYGLN